MAEKQTGNGKTAGSRRSVRYDPKTKSAILQAVIVAKAAGRKWADAHQVAKAAGYGGSLDGLVKMFAAAKKTKKGGRTVPFADLGGEIPFPSKPKKADGRQRYDPATKKAILDAVQRSRAGGGKWSEAYGAAKAAGYSGTQGGLVQMALAAKIGKKRKSRKAKGGTIKPLGGEVPTPFPKNVGDLSTIHAAIEAEVQRRVSDAIAKAVEALTAAE